ncbi:histidine phosphatase family protein [Hyphobacterium sp. HN65]|uniref:Histidine phosphatase family protein n=1 Tax=Hyphobacterium lacteum TaxID=3116575 RepID=A0ABU7LPP4_9PROT|nr:histidine phosphatase family protein [Hyphobacterium sp. HN65]MEE2525579.1 histidine phosphatase family protein [Hyphobacterium sp. HN65]
MTLLLLARHGNTFGPGDRIVWVGAREDLPLVKSGEAQAAALGEKLREFDLAPASIVSGPLKRTRRASEIIKAITASDAPIDIDTRLTEIDYGSWGGKTDEEIDAEFGPDAIPDWREHHRRPANAGWSPDDAALEANALGVLADHQSARSPALVITSNGILRYFHAALGFDGDAKVKTGHVCAARHDGRQWRPIFWNIKPEDMPEVS